MNLRQTPGDHAGQYKRPGQESGLTDKFSIMLCITKNLFLPAHDIGDIQEPVVVRQNSEFNIFPLVQQALKHEFRVTAEKFWGSVRSAGLDSAKEIWRPRFQGSQIKCLGTVRYPRTEKEWANLHAALLSIGPFLLPQGHPQHLFEKIQSFVSALGSLWKSDRRSRGKRQWDAGDGGSDGPNKRIIVRDNQRLTLPPNQHAGQNTDQTLGKINSFDGLEQIAEECNGTRMQSESEFPSDYDDQPLEEGKIIALLMVGGKEFTTTIGTLTSIAGSFFSKLIKSTNGASEFFIDRSPNMFEYILGYLRTARYKEPIQSLPLPNKIEELELLHRDCMFYKLPDLAVMVEQQIQKKKRPRLDIFVLETPVVDSDQALQKEIQILTANANSLMETKINASNCTDVIDISSQKLHIYEQDEGHRTTSVKRARLIVHLTYR